eukprot:jgi/Antlo1/447/1777
MHRRREGTVVCVVVRHRSTQLTRSNQELMSAHGVHIMGAPYHQDNVLYTSALQGHCRQPWLVEPC